MTQSAQTENAVLQAKRPLLYQRIWRWHFFAGLLVAPISVLLAITGAIYVFAPHINHVVDNVINTRSELFSGNVLSADEQVRMALATHTDASLTQYTMPRLADPSAQIDIRLANGEVSRLWVNIFSGKVLSQQAPDDQISEVVKKLHSELLNGKAGSILVELAASWMVILIITGCYLYWPRKLSGHSRWRHVFLPKLGAVQGRQRLHALHGAVASWSAVFILLFLFSGFPWTQVWGAAFTWTQNAAGVPPVTQEWRVTLKSNPQPNSVTQKVSLQSVIDTIAKEQLAPPITIKPPKPQGVWTVRNMHPDRAQRLTLHFDQWTGAELMRIDFASKHWFQRLVSNGVSLHEGHLFGVLNHVFSVLLALCVIVIAVTGPLMWWRRRPQGTLSAPALPSDKHVAKGVVVLIVGLAIFLPVAGASMVLVAVVDHVLSRFSKAN